MDASCSIVIRKSVDHPVAIFSGNHSALGWATDGELVWNSTEHIDAQIIFVRRMAHDGEISIKYVISEENDADSLREPIAKFIPQKGLAEILLHEQHEEEC